MVEILPRSAWTTTPNGRANRPLSPGRVDALTLHYPAAGNTPLARLSKAQVAERLRGWRNYHVGKDWADIGYNYAVDGAGRIWFLTGPNVGAHASAVGNTTSVGVLLVLANTEEPTVKMLAALRALRAHLIDGPLPNARRVQGHQQVPGNATSCPGVPVMKVIRSGVLTVTPKPASRGPRVDVALKELRAEVVRLQAAKAASAGAPRRQKRIKTAIQSVRLARRTLQQIKKK